MEIPYYVPPGIGKRHSIFSASNLPFYKTLNTNNKHLGDISKVTKMYKCLKHFIGGSLLIIRFCMLCYLNTGAICYVCKKHNPYSSEKNMVMFFYKLMCYTMYQGDVGIQVFIVKLVLTCL